MAANSDYEDGRRAGVNDAIALVRGYQTALKEAGFTHLINMTQVVIHSLHGLLDEPPSRSNRHHADENRRAAADSLPR